MYKLKNNQKGFSPVEVLFVILFLVAIGSGGYYVWHTQHKTSSTKTTAISTSTAAAPAQQYLTIKQWDIRIPLPRSSDVNMADIYYVYYPQTGSSSNDQAYVSLASYKLSALTSYCSPQASKHSPSPFGYIIRMTPASYQQANQSQSTSMSGTLFDSYYYVWLPTGGECYQDINSQITAGVNKLTDNGVRSIDNFPENIDVLLRGVQVIPKS